MRWPLQPLQLSKKHNSNNLSVHQWIRSAIHASQQLTSPIVSYPWNFRHRRVRYYWYDGNNNNCGWTVMNNEHMSNKSKHSCQQGELSISSKLVKTTTQNPCAIMQSHFLNGHVDVWVKEGPSQVVFAGLVSQLMRVRCTVSNHFYPS